MSDDVSGTALYCTASLSICQSTAGAPAARFCIGAFCLVCSCRCHLFGQVLPDCRHIEQGVTTAPQQVDVDVQVKVEVEIEIEACLACIFCRAQISHVVR